MKNLNKLYHRDTYLDKVINNFNKAAATYDDVAIVQKLSSQQLITSLLTHYPSFVPQSILDIGAGTGITAQQLLQHFPKSDYLLNDVSVSMLDMAKKKLPAAKNIQYLVGDAEYINFPRQDLIISNCAMQWFNNIFTTINKLYFSADVFAFSTLIDGTLIEWDTLYRELNITPPTLDYPTKRMLEEYCYSLQCSDYFFTTMKYKLLFKSRLDFAYYLKALGANTTPETYSTAYALRNIFNKDKPIMITYHIMTSILQNKGHMYYL